MDATEYNRPRKPNADTLSYLKSLPFDERTAETEIQSYINYKTSENKEEEDEKEEVEYPQTLSAALAALSEIQNEIASLAGDEFGSQAIETIARITTAYSQIAVRKLLFGIQGYMIHLSTHRYASHVVQTLLQCVLVEKGSQYGDVLELQEEEEEEDASLPSLMEILYNLVEEIKHVAQDLAVHVCGSHVLRSLICVIAGCQEQIPLHLQHKPGGGTMETGGNRRGKVKNKKKKKKNKTVMIADGGSNANNVQYELVQSKRLDWKHDDMQQCLYQLIQELTSLDLSSDDLNDPSQPGALQQLACNPSAGPLLIMLLKILTLRSNSDNDSSKSNITTVATEEDKANQGLHDFRLGIQAPQAQFPSSSQAERLAKHILCWDESTEDGTQQQTASDIIYGLSGETRGSHLVECLLRISNDQFYDAFCKAGGFFTPETFIDYAKHEVSNFVMQTLLNTARTRDQVEALIKCVESMINDGYILDAKNKRRGIFWRAVEMAAKFRIGQETIIKCMKKGFGTLQSKPSVDIEVCIGELINFQKPEDGKRMAELDAIGARAFYQLLRFVPRLCGEMLTAFDARYDASEVESMCNDGHASRCIIDGILDGPTNQKPFTQGVKSLFEKLKGRFVALSLERVGHHTVSKLFLRLSTMEDRSVLSEELANGLNRLNSNAMGRKIIIDCAAKDYLEGEQIWTTVVKKRLDKDTFLKDLEASLLGSTGEKKRKRKRKKASGDGDSNNNEAKMVKTN